MPTWPEVGAGPSRPPFGDAIIPFEIREPSQQQQILRPPWQLRAGHHISLQRCWFCSQQLVLLQVRRGSCVLEGSGGCAGLIHPPFTLPKCLDSSLHFSQGISESLSQAHTGPRSQATAEPAAPRLARGLQNLHGAAILMKSTQSEIFSFFLAQYPQIHSHIYFLQFLMK